MDISSTRLAIIGLGYVGLPLAVAFGRKIPVVGFDINRERVSELRAGIDRTLEVDSEMLASASNLTYADSLGEVAGCNVFVVTVPTPIDNARQPDFDPLLKSSAESW